MKRRLDEGSPWDPVVGGVLVRLSGDVGLRRAALGMLEGHAGLTLGQVSGAWVVVVLEARNAGEARDLHAWLWTVPGVEWVEVVSVEFPGPGLEDMDPAADTAMTMAMANQEARV